MEGLINQLNLNKYKIKYLETEKDIDSRIT